MKILCGHATELFGKLDVSTRCSKNSGSMKIYITENDVTLFLVCVWGGVDLSVELVSKDDGIIFKGEAYSCFCD